MVWDLNIYLVVPIKGLKIRPIKICELKNILDMILDWSLTGYIQFLIFIWITNSLLVSWWVTLLPFKAAESWWFLLFPLSLNIHQDIPRLSYDSPFKSKDLSFWSNETGHIKLKFNVFWYGLPQFIFCQFSFFEQSINLLYEKIM